MTRTTSEFDHKKYLKLISKRKHLFVIVALAIMTGAVTYSFLQPERYLARCTVFIEKSLISSLVQGIAAPPSDDKIRVLAYAMKSRAFLLKVIQDLESTVGKLNREQQEGMVRELQEGTDIRLQDKEGLFTIAFAHENPVFARDYVNALVRRYIKENVSTKREESKDASQFLSEQIATIKQKLDRAEAGVNSFKREKGSILADNEQNILRDISDARQKMDDIGLKRSELERQRSVDPLSNRLAALQKRLDELLIVYTESYPEVINVKNEIATVKEEMKRGGGGSRRIAAKPQEVERIDVELKTLREAEQKLKRFIASRQALMHDIPATRAAFEELDQERISQKVIYDQLVARKGQSEVGKQIDVQDKATNFRVVDPAILPTKHVNPKKLKLILFGIFAGLAGSFSLLVLLDYFDKSVRDLDTLKSLGVAVLAVVPKIEKPGELEESKKRDLRFFICTGAYFSIILLALSIEVMRNFGMDIMELGQVKQHLSQLQNMRIW